MYRMVLYLLHFLVLFISESNGQRGYYCRQDKPVVRFCTDNGFTNLTDVDIDTSRVPWYQETVCECTIFPFDSGVVLLFSYYDKLVPRNMVFKINSTLLNAVINTFALTVNSAKLTILTTKNYTTEGTCLIVSADDNSRFNITCGKGKDAIIRSSTSSTLDRSETSTGQVSETSTGQVTDTSTGQVTDTKSHVIIIAVPTVIGALLILAAVILLVYVKRRRRPNENILWKQEQDKSFSNPVAEQIQGQQNNSENEERNLDISVNTYEKLNLYVNDKLAGEMYQQLGANKTEEYQEMYDVKRDYANQDRKITKQTDLQEAEHDRKRSKAEQLKGQSKGQGHNSNGGETDLEILPHEYERLNMYVNDNLAGEMYQQLQVDQTGDYREKNVASNVDKAVDPASPEYTNEI